MKTEKMFDIGEQVLIKMKVVKREFDERGNIKYRLKDEKSGKVLDWQYSGKEMINYKNKSQKKIKETEDTEDV